MTIPLSETVFGNYFQQLSLIEEILEVEDGSSAIQLIKKENPELVFMDITMPHIDGIEATRQILHNRPKTRIIILTVHANKALLEQARKAGACGYLVK